ncbi:MAG: glycosyl transferase family 1, partial [Verrucomicrobia bacterium CG22_combo_CG10-13_8_21_14_all_43_17]
FSIEPTSEEYIVEQIAVHIETLFDDRELLYKMSEAAYKRALPMRWENKIQRLLEIYTEAMKEEQSS